MRIASTTTSGAGLREKRERLAAEIKDAEGKLARLRAALEVRKRNLSRLEAELALQGEEARGLRRHE